MLFNHFGESYFTKTINKDCEYYIKDKNGNTKLLFCLKKNALDKNLWSDTIHEIYDENILISNNRNITSSAQRQQITSSCPGKTKKMFCTSGIVGYYDKIPEGWKKDIPFYWGGRQTRYTRDKPEQFKKIEKMASLVEKIYKKSCPDFYKKHKKESDKILPEFKIGKTVFTTGTVNKNTRSIAHRDKSDLEGVLSCLICLGKNFKCKLGFPEYKVAVNLQAGDLILMDSKEIHCNTELHLKKEDSFRYTVVFYTKASMHRFKHKVQVKKGSSDYVYLDDTDHKRYKKITSKNQNQQ